MLAVIPYEVRTLISWNPWANIGLIIITIITSAAAWAGAIPLDILELMVLQEWNPAGMLGSSFLHAGVFHLIGNLIYLWVFGNALNGVMHHVLYLVIYLMLAMAGSAAHLLADGSPAVGASDAISGLLGLYAAVYPLNRIHCGYIVLFRVGGFDLPGYLLISLWFLLQLFGAMGDSNGVAYWAHIGGFAAGFTAGLILLKLKLIYLGNYDNPTMLDYLTGRGPGY